MKLTNGNKKGVKRIFASLLAAMLIVAMMPVLAMADELQDVKFVRVFINSGDNATVKTDYFDSYTNGNITLLNVRATDVVNIKATAKDGKQIDGLYLDKDFKNLLTAEATYRLSAAVDIEIYVKASDIPAPTPEPTPTPADTPAEVPTAPAFVAGTYSIKVGSNILTINDQEIEMTGTVFLSEGTERTMVGLRDLLHIFGVKDEDIAFSPETGLVSATFAGMSIEYSIATQEVKINGTVIASDTPPILVDDVTYVPIRIIVETILQVPVNWDDALKAVAFVIE